MKTETIAQWLTVQQGDINKPESKNQNGVKIQFMLSPSDIPAAWRAFKHHENRHDQQFIIEFKYLSSSEPVRTIDQGGGVQFEIGKNSRRIYQIILNANDVCGDRDEVKVEIKLGILAENSVEQMEISGNLNKGNADAIRRFLKPLVLGTGNFPRCLHSG